MIRSLKRRLAAGRLCVGSWITLAHPAIAEIMAAAGFDWLAVDLEHSVITIREAEELIRVISRCGVEPLVRLTSNDGDLIKRVMDGGATGVIVPMVNSVRDAQRAVESVYYPPRGRRGVGLARAQQYGAGFATYRKWLTREAVVIVQIEHRTAVENIREILGVDGVDGYLVGPYDLSASLGVPGQFKDARFRAALAAIHRAGRDLGKPGGVHIIEPEPRLLKQAKADGRTLIAYSLDIRMLDVSCRRGLREGLGR